MISFDFDYYRPGSVKEATDLYVNLISQGKAPIYYAGGTEIISMARLNQISFDSVIDIKEIPECNVLELQNNKLVIGTAVTLTKISDSGLYPLLGKISRTAADHTARDKITLGGNVCGKTQYREAILPFLVCDSQAVIAGTNGLRNLPLSQIYNEGIVMEQGEILLQLITDKSYLGLPFESRKRTKNGGMDYPLASIAAMIKDNNVRAAFSGLCAYPFRSEILEDCLNDKSVPLDNRIDKAVASLPAPILNDLQGSAEFRIFILKNILRDVLIKLQEAKS